MTNSPRRGRSLVERAFPRVEKADLLERRRAAIHHRRAGGDAREQISEGGRAVCAIREGYAAPLWLVLQPGDRVRPDLDTDRRLDARLNEKGTNCSPLHAVERGRG